MVMRAVPQLAVMQPLEAGEPELAARPLLPDPPPQAASREVARTPRVMPRERNLRVIVMCGSVGSRGPGHADKPLDTMFRALPSSRGDKGDFVTCWAAWRRALAPFDDGRGVDGAHDLDPRILHAPRVLLMIDAHPSVPGITT
ncbi:MAG: hypothetical protein U1F11_05860 [Steroidobacteraceae bacterium]